jgi:hypothetical protein
MYPPVWVKPTNHRATRTVSCEVAQARIAAEWIDGPRAAELGTVAVVAIVTAAAIVTQRHRASTLRAVGRKVLFALGCHSRTLAQARSPLCEGLNLARDLADARHEGQLHLADASGDLPATGSRKRETGCPK